MGVTGSSSSPVVTPGNRQGEVSVQAELSKFTLNKKQRYVSLIDKSV